MALVEYCIGEFECSLVPLSPFIDTDSKYVTAKTILQQFILNNLGERTEMSHSIEGRPPFLDHHLVEYINTLPA